MKTKELTLQSERNRKRLIEIIYKAKAGHIGGDLSCLNVLTALYFDVKAFWIHWDNMALSFRDIPLSEFRVLK